MGSASRRAVDQWLSYGSELPIILVHVADTQIADVADRFHHHATATGKRYPGVFVFLVLSQRI